MRAQKLTANLCWWWCLVVARDCVLLKPIYYGFRKINMWWITSRHEQQFLSKEIVFLTTISNSTWEILPPTRVDERNSSGLHARLATQCYVKFPRSLRWHVYRRLVIHRRKQLPWTIYICCTHGDVFHSQLWLFYNFAYIHFFHFLGRMKCRQTK